MRLPNILQLRDFRNLWIGQTISQFGDSVYILVLLFMADKVTGNALIVGLVGIMQAIPFVAFGPVAGTMADRVDRRRQMVMADYLSVAVTGFLGVYALINPNPPAVILAVAAFLLATAHTFFMPARSAAIPSLVPSNRVLEANGFAMASQQVVSMVGIGLSASALGAIYKIAPQYFFPAAIFVNCLTFAGSAFYLVKLPEIKAQRAQSAERASTWTEAKEGFRLVRTDPVTSIALPINAISTLSISGFMVVYVETNKRWYGGEFGTLALIEFGFAATMMLFCLFVGRLKIRRVGLSFALSHIALGVLVMLMSVARPYGLFLFVNVLCGVALPFLILPLNTYLQTAIPDQMRGRVNSAWALVSQGLIPIGIGATAILLGFGLEAAFLVMGLGLTLAGAAGFLSPRFIKSQLPLGTELEPLGDVQSAQPADFMKHEGEIFEPLAEALEDGRL